MHLLIFTDAFEYPFNGVVRTMNETGKVLKERGHEVEFINPYMSEFKYFGCPGYDEIPLVYNATQKIIHNIIKKYKEFTHIHIATEGPIGLAGRKYCIKNNLKFTTSYHTNFPDYVNKMFRIPKYCTYQFLSWFHKHSSCVMATNEDMKNELIKNKFKNKISVWGRGVNVNDFNPDGRNPSKTKTYLYVGRVSIEKGLDDFLSLYTPEARKLVVGTGPMLATYQHKYAAHAQFLGPLEGKRLKQAYADADVFVFPSKTDTFGLVLIESMACGTPIAAYNANGPKQIIEQYPNAGATNEILIEAIKQAEKCDRKLVREAALNYSWESATDQFTAALVGAHD